MFASTMLSELFTTEALGVLAAPTYTLGLFNGDRQLHKTGVASYGVLTQIT
ncbi:MAG: hypothetical protein L0220_00455 [Acidobacteria bacterium]|nr:hypothetical protein [Acidobacteriota bacterium]